VKCGCATAEGSPTIADRAAMCQTCDRSRRNASGSAVECRVLGRPIVAAVVESMACPIGRWPDARGRVRWLGLWWLGVPEPLRWRLVAALRREPRGLTGCGCVAALKESRLGPIVEPWAEGVGLLRARLAALLGDWFEAFARRTAR
jgi:hypothetical protein